MSFWTRIWEPRTEPAPPVVEDEHPVLTTAAAAVVINLLGGSMAQQVTAFLAPYVVGAVAYDAASQEETSSQETDSPTE